MVEPAILHIDLIRREDLGLTETSRNVMMVSHHHSCPVVVAMPLRCVKHPGPVPPPTVAFGSSPLCEQHTGDCEGGVYCKL